MNEDVTVECGRQPQDSQKNTAAPSYSSMLFLLLTTSCVRQSMIPQGWIGSCVLVPEPWGSRSWHVPARLISETTASECLRLGWFSRTNQIINKTANYIHIIIVLLSHIRIQIYKPYESVHIECRNTCYYQWAAQGTEKQPNERSQEFTESCFGLQRNLQQSPSLISEEIKPLNYVCKLRNWEKWSWDP